MTFYKIGYFLSQMISLSSYCHFGPSERLLFSAETANLDPIAIMGAFLSRAGEYEDGMTWEEWPLRAKVAQGLAAQSLDENYAIASLIYGTSLENLLQAIPLGESLAAEGSRWPRILLHTWDVPGLYLKCLSKYWTLVEIPYIQAESVLVEKLPHLCDVFTKLHIFNHDVLPFSKVLFLDLDVLVTHSLDGVWEVQTPAAVCCSSFYDDRGKTLTDKGYQHGDAMQYLETFNGGVLLVRPDSDVFRYLKADVEKPSSWHMATTYPESHFMKCLCPWFSLANCFNMSVRLAKGQSLTSEWLKYDLDDITVVHFLADAKPYRWLLRGHIPAIDPRTQYLEDASFVQQRSADALRRWCAFMHFGVIHTAASLGWRPSFQHCIVLRAIGLSGNSIRKIVFRNSLEYVLSRFHIAVH